MTKRIRYRVAMHAIVLSGTIVIAPMPVANALGPAVQTEDPNPRTASDWIAVAESRRAQGNHAGAGEATARALDAMSESRQRGNNGANAAKVSAEHYRRAFEFDGDITHLRAGVAILERWLELTGPRSRASLHPRVETMRDEFHAVLDPLERVRSSMAGGQLAEATDHSREALNALNAQGSSWVVGARIVLELGNECVDAYDRNNQDNAHVERAKLEAAKALALVWRAERTTADDTKEGQDIDELLADIEMLLDESDQQATKLAKERQAERVARKEREAADTERHQRTVQQATASRRRRSIALLTIGLSATGAGAGLLGDGIAFRSWAERRVAAQRAEAMGVSGEDFDQSTFDASTMEYEQRVRARTTAEIVVGSILVAGGTAASVLGIVGLLRNRKLEGGQGYRAWLRPFMSRTQLGLSLSARF